MIPTEFCLWWLCRPRIALRLFEVTKLNSSGVLRIPNNEVTVSETMGLTPLLARNHSQVTPRK
ncbi:MAG: hypothetical protein LBT50_00670 [Prevotellaceae bacterium]|nr:hypothetical protein [Prevotellaceae bacterium]